MIHHLFPANTSAHPHDVTVLTVGGGADGSEFVEGLSCEVIYLTGQTR